MDHEDTTDRRNAAIEAGRLFAAGDVGNAERCHACGELLHPYPDPEYWMQYPLPGCCVLDGLRFCDDDRKPECIDSHLVKHPTPTPAVRPKKRGKKGGVEERLLERNEVAGGLAAKLPDDRAGLLAVAAEAVVACHRAVMASDGAAAEAAANRYDASIWKLNGGTYQGCKDGANPEAAGTLIEKHCRAAPGVVPMWGQSGEFLVESGGVRCMVEFGDGFGSLLDRHFAFNVIDLDRPFISETGYRSHFETAQGGRTVLETATVIFGSFLRSHRRYIAEDARRRLAEQPLPGWLLGLERPARRAMLARAEDWTANLPEGFVLVDAVLPAAKAFQARKWAAAAQAKIVALRAGVDSRRKSQEGSSIARNGGGTGAITCSIAGDGEGGQLREGQRCEIVKEPREAFRDRIGKVVVIAKVYPEEGCVFAYDDKPITYKTNRKGRRVVDHDPSCIQTVYCIDALRVK